jgi:hypothetical protein
MNKLASLSAPHSLSKSLALSTQMHKTMAIIKGLNSICSLDSSLARADLGKSLNFKIISKR